jgi:hypothetical protein
LYIIKPLKIAKVKKGGIKEAPFVHDRLHWPEFAPESFVLRSCVRWKRNVMKTVAKNKTLSDITDAMSLDVLNMIADERALLSQHDETKSIASILAIKCKHERQGNGMITLEVNRLRQRQAMSMLSMYVQKELITGHLILHFPRVFILMSSMIQWERGWELMIQFHWQLQPLVLRWLMAGRNAKWFKGHCQLSSWRQPWPLFIPEHCFCSIEVVHDTCPFKDKVCRGDLLIGVGAYDVKKLTPNEFKEGVGVWNLWYGQISDDC